MPQARLSITESLWIRGEKIATSQRNAISETAALQARGAKIFLLKSARDQEGLNRLKRLLWESDVHAILSWLHPNELHAIFPILKERGNYSLLTDDWFIHPYDIMRGAEYILFRKYHGIAVRLGQAQFVSGAKPPLWFNPRPETTKYSATCALLRPAALTAAPFINAWNAWRRRDEVIDPGKLLYFPFAIEPTNVPLGSEKPLYDFANTGGTSGAWFMRDAYAPFQYSFANLYQDRRQLTDAIAQFENNPFKFYDCRREKNKFLPYAQYILKNQQSRYLIASGGLHDCTVPKYMEYACVGTPMIGRSLPFDYPWLDDCLFPVDMMSATPETIKPLLVQALDVYPKLRQNCLNWRDRLLKLYDLQTLLDVLQEQADGKPIRPGYLKVDAKEKFRIDTQPSPPAEL
jgi:hypothetical protein